MHETTELGPWKRRDKAYPIFGSAVIAVFQAGRTWGLIAAALALFLATPHSAHSQVNDTSTTVLTVSSASIVAGGTVTLTASVTNDNDNFVPTGTVTFTDLTTGATLGSDFRVGGAEPLVFTLTVSTLAVGNHTIRARFGGGNYVGGGGIPHTVAASDSNTVTVSVNAPADSLRLRSMQTAASTLAANASTQAVSGAIETVVAEGFADNANPVTAGGNGLRFNFAASPERQNGRANDAFASLPSAGVAGTPLPRVQSDWLAWADVKAKGWDTEAAAGGIRGDQFNALAGVTRRLGSDALVGAFAGMESLDYRSQPLDARLKGDGWTAGAYFGWRLAPALRFDLAAARTDLDYDVSAGSAKGAFDAVRRMVSAGLTGTYKAGGFDFEPSLRGYVFREKQEAYTDSLGTPQRQRSFSGGRVSAGARAAYPLQWLNGARLAPYLGLYGDYYFSSDDAHAGPNVAVAPQTTMEGASLRLTSGLDWQTSGGLRLSVGGELGGLGSDHLLWSARGRASMPF